MKSRLCVALVLALSAGLPLTTVAQTYTYDSLGRVSSVIQPNGTKTIYYYDTADNRTGTQTALSGTTTLTAPAVTTVVSVSGATNLRTLANSLGYAGSTTAAFEFVVPAGVTVAGTGGNPGTTGIDTGTWPSGVVLTLLVSGNVYGGGGQGGAGSQSAAGLAGDTAGDAIYVQAPITIVVASGATVKGGGGGGGGGAGFMNHSDMTTTGGGGGGGGFPNGPGGHGTPGATDPGASGTAGTTSGGGAGGAADGGAGGTGGNAATAGTAGGAFSTHAGGAAGAAGYAIRKNGNTVTYTNNGTVTGTVG